MSSLSCKNWGHAVCFYIVSIKVSVGEIFFIIILHIYLNVVLIPKCELVLKGYTCSLLWVSFIWPQCMWRICPHTVTNLSLMSISGSNNNSSIGCIMSTSCIVWEGVCFIHRCLKEACHAGAITLTSLWYKFIVCVGVCIKNRKRLNFLLNVTGFSIINSVFRVVVVFVLSSVFS